MTFSSIKGNLLVKNTIISMVQNNRLAHAQMFYGPEGSATTALALASMQYINCQNKQNLDACNKCSSCMKISNMSILNIFFSIPLINKGTKLNSAWIVSSMIEWKKLIKQNPYVTMEEWNKKQDPSKQLNIGISQSREIIKYASLSSHNMEYKFIVIWMSEFMNNSAANALLKIIEEPPKKTIFFFISNNLDKHPPTIISRLQCHYIKPFTALELEQEIIDRFSVSAEEAKSISILCEGNMCEAFRVQASKQCFDNFENFKIFARSAYTQKFSDILKQAETFYSLGKDFQKFFCVYSIKILRAILLIKCNKVQLANITPEEISFVDNMSKTLNFFKIKNMFLQLEKLLYEIERNANIKIAFLNTFINISHIFKDC